VYTGAPYELWHTIPPNATQYIFQALKPRYFYKSLCRSWILVAFIVEKRILADNVFRILISSLKDRWSRYTSIVDARCILVFFQSASNSDFLRWLPVAFALVCRIVFSAHTHEFCDHTHSDGTREITVPSMTWKARDDPGFVFATFRSGGNTVSVSYCSLARESHVLIAYTLILFLLITLWLVANKPYNMCLR
jgi:hypothetical protein